MMTTEYNELGAVHIADKVIAGIAVEAALAVKVSPDRPLPLRKNSAVLLHLAE